MPSSRHRRVAALVTALLAGAVAGCAMERTVLEDSAVDAFGGVESELDFWDELATRRVVTNDDALHGLLLLAGEDGGADYASRLEAARGRGWISESASPPKNESAAVGMIAVAVCDILDIEGGVTMRLFGHLPRYCTRELVFLEIIPGRTENQSLSGLEFIDLAGRVEDAMTGRRPGARLG